MTKQQVWYVYELVNLMGTVEYVGESLNPKKRLRQHTKTKPRAGVGSGKFFGRQDLILHIVAGFDNRKDAWEHQCNLQTQYGMESDLIKNQQSACLSRKISKEIADLVREEYSKGNTTYRKLRAKYDLNQNTVHQIIHHQTYNL